MTSVLFDKGPSEIPSPAEVAEPLSGQPRLRVPERQQIEMQWRSLDELLETDHQARLVWIAVCGLNLGRWLTQVKAVERNVGRNSTDPRLLGGGGEGGGGGGWGLTLSAFHTECADYVAGTLRVPSARQIASKCTTMSSRYFESIHESSDAPS